MVHNVGFGYSQDTDWAQFTDNDIEVLENLPHGSGIDYDWTAEKLSNGKVQAWNSYHAMSETGYYVFSFDFSVTFDTSDLDGFRLQFHGKASHNRLNTSYGYGLRDYLEETIHYNITS